MPSDLPFSDRFPKEFGLIGRMLSVYGELEFDLMACVSAVHDIDLAMKAIFRPMGETNRVDIADALARAAYEKVGLQTEFTEAIGNFRFCLGVRNQYAHCKWFYREDIGLGFIHMRGLAEQTKHLSKTSLMVYPFDLPLLEAQDNYFGYVQDCLRYTTNQYVKKKGGKTAFSLPKPKRLKQPLQRKPGIRPPRQTPPKGGETPPEADPLGGGRRS